MDLSQPEPAASAVDAGRTDAAPLIPHVQLRGVSLVYGGGERQLLALDRLDMHIRHGEFVAVVGPSGCGKSTLMKLVPGLLPPDAGDVTMNGVPVNGTETGIGMAFQNSILMPWRTTRRNVMLPLEVVQPHKRRLARERAAYEARADAILASVGLDGFADKYPWELSGGMQQRASLCRALIHEPQLLMLDEPFGALDAFTREELWTIMQSLWLQRHFTAILVTHDLREAVFLADTVYVMSQRPGRMMLRRIVDLPRPRTLADSFDPRFVGIVHELRDCISVTRGTQPA